MKNFTLVLSIAMMAAVPVLATRSAAPAKVENLSLTNAKHLAAGKRVAPVSIQDLAKTAKKKAAAHRAVAIDVRPSSNTIIESVEGTHTYFARASDGYAVFWGYLFYTEDEGLAVDKVVTEDGRVFLSNLFSSFPTNGYVEFSQNGDTLSLTAPQCVYTEPVLDDDYNPTDSTIFAYATPMEYVEGEEGGWYYASDKPYQLVKQGDNYVSVDSSMVIGLSIWNDSQGGLAFTGYADYNLTYSPMTDVALTSVDGTPEKWAVMFPDGSGYFSEVVTTDNAVYVKGIHSGCPDAWVKIDVDGNKGTLQPQFLGKSDNWHWAYAMGGTVEEIWNEEYGYSDFVVTPQGPAEFSYDAATKKLFGEGYLMIAPTTSGNSYTDYNKGLVIEHQTRTPGTPPCAPSKLVLTPFSMDDGYGRIDFNLPCVDTDKNLLECSNLSYKIYVDGEVFTAYPDEYKNLSEEMSEFPWGFQDEWDFYATGISHTACFYMTGFETIGVQTIYREPTDNTLVESEITTVKCEVDGLHAIDAPVKSVEYFDLQGRAVAKPANGLYIRRTTLADGTVNTSKVVK